MIYREAEDRFAIRTLGREINLELTGQELRKRLEDTGLWLTEQIDGVLALEIGDHTPAPEAKMIEEKDLDAYHFGLGSDRAELEFKSAFKRGVAVGFWRQILGRHSPIRIAALIAELPHLTNRIVHYRDCYGVARFDFTDSTRGADNGTA